MTKPTGSSSDQSVKIWDIWVRLFHWSLAAAVIFLLISGETGWQYFELHRVVGEGVLLLILFRLCWSLVGSSNAGLIRLLAPPRRVFHHIAGLLSGNVGAERGHNAAGGYAVLLMLFLIGFQAVSGLFITDEDELVEGVFYGALSTPVSEQLHSLHHMNAGIIQTVVILHVVVVFLYLLRAGCNLIAPMFTGRMRWPGEATLPALKAGNTLLGLVMLCSLIVLLGWLLSWWQ